MIRSKPNGDIVDKHESFMLHLSRLPNEWGIKVTSVPEVKDPGTLPRREVKLSKYMVKGVKGWVSYQNRKFYEEKGRYDDYFILEFNPEKHDYHVLAMECFSSYIQSFHGYVGEIADEEFIYLDFEQERQGDSRDSVYRVFPVSFFSDELCHKAFGLTMEEVAKRLVKHVQKISLESNGVLVISTAAPLALEEAIATSDKLKALLHT